MTRHPPIQRLVLPPSIIGPALTRRRALALGGAGIGAAALSLRPAQAVLRVDVNEGNVQPVPIAVTASAGAYLEAARFRFRPGLEVRGTAGDLEGQVVLAGPRVSHTFFGGDAYAAALFGANHIHHLLSGLNHLADFGFGRSHHAVELGVQLCVAELFLRHAHIRLRRFLGRRSAFELMLRRLEFRFRVHSSLE